MIQLLRSKGVRIITHARVIEILADGVRYLKSGREETFPDIDTIVLAVDTNSDNVLSEK